MTDTPVTVTQSARDAAAEILDNPAHTTWQMVDGQIDDHPLVQAIAAAEARGTGQSENARLREDKNRVIEAGIFFENECIRLQSELAERDRLLKRCEPYVESAPASIDTSAERVALKRALSKRYRAALKDKDNDAQH